jgi:hypothetical protein
MRRQRHLAVIVAVHFLAERRRNRIKVTHGSFLYIYPIIIKSTKLSHFSIFVDMREYLPDALVTSPSHEARWPIAQLLHTVLYQVELCDKTQPFHLL